MYSLKFDHIFFIIFSFFFHVLFFFLMCPAWLRNEEVPKSMISMTKAFNIWLAAWNLPYGPQRKKKVIKIFHFPCNLSFSFSPPSLSLALSFSLSHSLFISLFQLSTKKHKPWLLRGVFNFSCSATINTNDNNSNDNVNKNNSTRKRQVYSHFFWVSHFVLFDQDRK